MQIILGRHLWKNGLSFYTKEKDLLLLTDQKWILWVFLNYQWLSDADVFLHPVIVVEDINDNIISIDFMHANRMIYDPASEQITFVHMLTNALYSLKKMTIPALSTMIINSKFKGTICDSANPVATIHAPTNPTISWMPALVTLDKYKHCHRQLCSLWDNSCQKWSFRSTRVRTRQVYSTQWKDYLCINLGHSWSITKGAKEKVHSCWNWTKSQSQSASSIQTKISGHSIQTSRHYQC